MKEEDCCSNSIMKLSHRIRTRFVLIANPCLYIGLKDCTHTSIQLSGKTRIDVVLCGWVANEELILSDPNGA